MIGRGTAFFSSTSIASYIGYCLRNSALAKTVVFTGGSPAASAVCSWCSGERRHIAASNVSAGCRLNALIA